MKYLVLAIVAANLTACGIIPAMYDRNDPCQIHNKPANYKAPDFCGAASAPITYYRDYRTNAVIATGRSY